MDYLIFGIVMLILIILFVASQVVAILFLMSENERIQKQVDENFPPF